jgi:hypothetical protein
VTGAPFGEVDLDLLADYAAGVLDDAESRRVGQVIESDPQWARAHRALIAADAAVAEQLRAVAQVELSIPEDVAARLEAALTDAHGASGGTDAPVVSLVGRKRRDRERGRRPARSGRLAIAWPRLAIAAAVIGVVLLGLPALGGMLTQRDGSGTATSGSAEFSERDSGGQGEPAAAPSSSDLDGAAGAPVSFSGTDYTPSTLKALSRMRVQIAPEYSADSAKTVPAPSSLQSSPPNAQQSTTGRAAGPVPTELARLLDPIALHACIAAIESVTPGRVGTVDFARYEGRPALVVTMTTTPAAAQDKASRVTVVVVGPACGVAGADRIAGTDRD